MGFRKSVKLSKGFKVNFSKSGVSSTFGRKGSSFSLGKRGLFWNIGIPGTGIHKRVRIFGGHKKRRSKKRRRAPAKRHRSRTVSRATIRSANTKTTRRTVVGPVSGSWTSSAVYSPRTYRTCSSALFVVAAISFLIALPTLAVGGVLFLGVAVCCIALGVAWRKKAAKMDPQVQPEPAVPDEARIWAMWDEAIHRSPEQIERMQRAESQGFIIKSAVPAPDGTYPVIGSTGNLYSTSFCECNCVDFRTRGLPCKHMYFLAQQVLQFDLSPYLQQAAE